MEGSTKYDKEFLDDDDFRGESYSNAQFSDDNKDNTEQTPQTLTIKKLPKASIIVNIVCSVLFGSIPALILSIVSAVNVNKFKKEHLETQFKTARITNIIAGVLNGISAFVLIVSICLFAIFFQQFGSVINKELQRNGLPQITYFQEKDDKNTEQLISDFTDLTADNATMPMHIQTFAEKYHLSFVKDNLYRSENGINVEIKTNKAHQVIFVRFLLNDTYSDNQSAIGPGGILLNHKTTPETIQTVLGRFNTTIYSYDTFSIVRQKNANNNNYIQYKISNTTNLIIGVECSYQ